MDWETESLSQLQEKLRRRQQHASAGRPSSQSMTPQIKMFVSEWDTDELGNRARIIKAHDSMKKGRPKPFAALFSTRMLAK